jgi:hypothetical protein
VQINIKDHDVIISFTQRRLCREISFKQGLSTGADLNYMTHPPIQL